MSKIDPLDILLSEAVHEYNRKKVKPLPDKDRLDRIKETFRSAYEKPENWERTRGVALIHRSKDGTTTLLGNFSEYYHKRNPLARKLVREAAPIPVEAQEFVTGDWWLRKDTLQRINDSNHHEVRITALDLMLEELQVFAHSVMVRVHLHQGWISRVELGEQTQFVCPLNSQFIYFPPGLDVMEGLSMETKMQLRKQLGI